LEKNATVTLRTRLTEKLDITHPVLLAPMGSVSGGRLAGAVSDAGGLGLIHHVVARQTARPARRRAGSSPGGADALVRRSAAVRQAHPGRRGRAHFQVQSRDHALQALDAGAEIIVAQGTEAGGHGGSRATLPLVPAIVDLVARRAPEVVVVAAGGFVDGRGLAAALALGAEGVLVGSRFYASVESLANDKAKARIAAASGDETVRTSVFDAVRGYTWPDGIIGRALRNDFTARWHGRERELAGSIDGEMARYREAAARGDPDTAVVFAGEGADLIDDVPSAGELSRGLSPKPSARVIRTAIPIPVEH
jgi:nitronate monooxygenase